MQSALDVRSNKSSVQRALPQRIKDRSFHPLDTTETLTLQIQSILTNTRFPEHTIRTTQEKEMFSQLGGQGQTKALTRVDYGEKIK